MLCAWAVARRLSPSTARVESPLAILSLDSSRVEDFGTGDTVEGTANYGLSGLYQAQYMSEKIMSGLVEGFIV